MGLFSSKKITYVSSVAYNLAGDEDERPVYIKALVLKNIMSGGRSLPDTLRSGYLNGPQMDLRRTYRYMARPGNYNAVGMPISRINGFEVLNYTTIANQLPAMTGFQKSILRADIMDADYTAWAEQYILNTAPELYDTEWRAFALDNGNITIEFEDDSVVVFTPTNFDTRYKYLYVNYFYYKASGNTATVTGPTTNLSPSDSWPSVVSWTVASGTNPTVTVPLTETVTTLVKYDDGRPDESTTTASTRDETYPDRHSTFTQSEYIGQDPDAPYLRLLTRHSTMYFDTDASVTSETNVTTNTEVIEGVTVTTTVTTVAEALSVKRKWRIDYYDQVTSEMTNKKILLYRIGSNSNMTLENMIAKPTQTQGEFYPVMPVRLENRFISNSYYPTVYEQASKAYKKLMNKKFSELIDKVNDNESLNDIDFAFVVFGVSLNVKEHECRKYLYKFFQKLAASQAYDRGHYDSFRDSLATYQTNMQIAIEQFLEDGRYPAGLNLRIPALQYNEIQLSHQGTSNIPYDVRLRWVVAWEEVRTGLGKAGAKSGDLWFVVRPTVTWNESYIDRGGKGQYDTYDPPRVVVGDRQRLECVRLYWQDSPNTYRYMEVYGLKHINFVYNGKSVEIWGNEAINDSDESGFIVPLHYDTMKDMSLKASTQMATACINIVFNCYQIVKQKWYQRGIFKILLVVAIAIVSAVFTGGAGLGLLGANFTVGASLGFAGLTAAIVGSVVNALAAVILTSVIQYASTALFGEQFGALIGAVLSFVVFNAATAFHATGSFTIDWSSLMRADNLLKLTDALASGYSAMVQGNAQGIMQDTRNLQTSYEKRSEEISLLYGKNIGYTDYMFNPNWITNSNNRYYESSSTFLTRTLLTGTEIVDLSHSMITNFTGLSLTLPSAHA